MAANGTASVASFTWFVDQVCSSSLLTWKRPVVSGLVFGSVNLIFGLVYFDCLISYGSYVAMTAVATGYVLSHIVSNLDSEDQIAGASAVETRIAGRVSAVMQLVVDVLTWKRTSLSVRALAILYGITFVSGVCSIFTVLCLFFNLAFTVPVALVKTGKQDVVKSSVETASQKARDLIAKIPRASKDEEAK
mmetsp:Transcript_95665/g.255687  ORF Transcript_95665/g.255687 Transcript_95665/m.255687 type:complete len:191 (+) Transcript_95665:82-654(+)